MTELSAADYESIDRAAHELHERGWLRAYSLDEMLEAWGALVSEIEQGYDQMAVEYTNDLACRDWLALVWPLVTERIREVTRDELAALDQRFMDATLDDGGAALATFYRVDNRDGWWWRRKPIKLAGEFAADLAGG